MGLFGKKEPSHEEVKAFRRGQRTSARAAEAYAAKMADRDGGKRAAKAIRLAREAQRKGK